MLKILLRGMRKVDLDIVSDLAVLANPFTTREKYRHHLLDELKGNPDLLFVAVENGRVVGYVQAEVRNCEAVLEDIAVAKEYQGKGIGKSC